MSSVRGPEGLESLTLSGEAYGGDTDFRLTEALIHLLVEKGVLTRNDALSVVETVAQVRLGSLHEGSHPDPDADPVLRKFRRMYASFEALDGRPGVIETDSENVVRLRPPIHGDHPEFPHDD
jgi:hypothetical protein